MYFKCVGVAHKSKTFYTKLAHLSSGNNQHCGVSTIESIMMEILAVNVGFRLGIHESSLIQLLLTSPTEIGTHKWLLGDVKLTVH